MFLSLVRWIFQKRYGFLRMKLLVWRNFLPTTLFTNPFLKPRAIFSEIAVFSWEIFQTYGFLRIEEFLLQSNF